MRKTGELRVLSLLHDNYRDFGPTLAAEKLRERYNITVSAETLRKWMAADGLWVRFCKVTQLLNDIQTYHILRHGGFYPKNSPAASDTAVCHFRRVQRHDFCPLWGLCHALSGNQT
ncbi:putative integrase/transposase [Escherichia coli]|nr:putative integrase/transposase [Escherichia coli]